MSLHDEGFKWQNVSASQAFVVRLGGKYLLIATATFGGGSVKLSALASDGSTYVDIANGSLTAAGTLTADLAPGSYRLTVTTATGVYASLARCSQG